ncbi:methylated-DNA--[protein]-cysteine S-methyltransferase [Bacillus alkalicellulosilyticus]|uniref:methylated-DNA--[protein]-cysteine S-methyltransferase n=1 Tax=Alkalihalobacterium alkalicellulosilyticum TaxID=1912214 RepID=UPI000997C397|nr:methylated-DNA--[protein]-cysteine S-methyltransferase [Bacillus alkalicellulosilyticus]
MSTQSNLFYDEIDSILGPITLLATSQGLCNLHFGMVENSLPTLKAWLKKHGIKGELQRDCDQLRPIVEQLHEYFSGQRASFTIPLDLFGTPFQKCVWNALTEIGYGETRTYKEIAQEIGAPKAVRAVGGANNQNPIPIIIPCHRVIGSNGAMVGYGGGLKKKETLLQIEGVIEKIS